MDPDNNWRKLGRTTLTIAPFVVLSCWLLGYKFPSAQGEIRVAGGALLALWLLVGSAAVFIRKPRRTTASSRTPRSWPEPPPQVDPLSPAEIQQLRDRWATEPVFRDLQRRINEALTGHWSRFCSQNEVKLKEVDAAGASDMFRGLRPDMFSQYLDLTALLPASTPRIRSEQTGKDLYDLRGYCPGNEGLGAVQFADVDLSYLWAPEELLGRGTILGWSSFHNCMLQGSKLRGWCLGWWYKDCHFIDVDLTQAGFARAFFDGCRFTRCRLRREKHSVLATDCLFEDCDFTRAYFCLSVLENCTFRRCKFKEAYLHNSTYRNCSFPNCDFRDVQMGFIPPEGGEHIAKLR